MPEQFTGTTFSSTYRDDFADSAGYHKVLFNSGRALQGRELNQLQTILQTQITRMANNIFMDGAAVSPKSSGAGTDIVDYVIVEELFEDASVYVGAVFQGPAVTGSNGLQFQVSFVSEASGGDFPTLYGRYLSANQNGVSTDVQTDLLTYNEAETLTNISGDGITALSVRIQPTSSTVESTGKGVLFSVQRAEFYTQGHFVYVPKQTLAIAKYVDYVDAEVGFQVIQDVVTTADDDALYDNQGSRPNLSAPGADRYRIRMILSTRDTVADAEDFVSFATVRASKIVQIKEGTDNFNQFEKRLAIRHNDTHGNFVVNDFEIQFREGDDSANMIYEIPAEQLGVRPLAFLDGFRLEHKIGNEFNVPKPTSWVSDSDESLNAAYKNYITFNADSSVSAIGPFGSFNNGLRNQELIQLLNGGTTVIGGARLKSVINRGTNDSDHFRFHLYAVNMKDGNNFRDVRSIRALGATGAGIVPNLEDNQLYLKQPENSFSLFEIPGGRVKSINVDNFTVQRQNSQNAVANTITITCAADEQFADEGQWTFINKSTNTVDEIGTGNIVVVGTTATITTSGATDAYDTFYYVQKNNPAPKSKTYREGWFDATRTSAGDSAGDVFEFNNFYDGVQLLEAYAVDSNGPEVTHAVEFDGGQRDNYYGPVQLRPEGVEKGITAIKAKIGYFEWGAGGDFFSVNSYDVEDSVWFDYGNIPEYVSRTSGDAYVLHNQLDFRSKLDPRATTMTATDRFELPRDGDQIQYGVQFYNHRLDHVALGYDDNYDAVIIINQGEESQQPVPPTEKQNEMVLFDVALPGNTKNANDLTWNRRQYRSYKMTDVNDIERRIARLEETVSLSSLEQEASSLVELNADGSVRSKTGFFVDDFTKGYALTASTINGEFIDDASFATSSLDDGNFTMHCKLDAESIGLNYDSDNLYSARGVTRSNIIKKGDNIMLDYVDVLDPTLKQEIISWKGGAAYEEFGYYNVNPFNVFMGEGVLRLNPSRDIWFDSRRLPDRHINGGTIIRRIGEPLIPRTFTFSRTSVRFRWVSRFVRQPQGQGMFAGLLGAIQGVRGGRRPTRWTRERGIQATTTTETFRVTQSVRTRVVGDQTFTRDLGDRTVSVLSVPFMRQRRVFASAEGLRPNTRYWCFMDGVKMDQWVKTRTESSWRSDIAAGANRRGYPSSNVSLRRNPFYDGAASQQLVSDNNGELYFEIWIPNNARIAVPLSSNFNTITEWTNWIDNSRRYAKIYGSVKSVNTLNRIGWKFRCGTKTIKLLDISVDNENGALSRARSTYSAWGRVSVRQRSLVHTRVISIQDQLTQRTDLIGRSTSSGTSWVNWNPRDPLAQTFTVDAGTGVPGVFVTKIDVFLHNAPRTSTNGGSDLAIPLELQIRSVDAGVPERDAISEQHRVFKTADACYGAISGMNKDNLASVLAHPVTFEFAEPVYLRSGEEYSFVLLAECDKYEAYVATTYDLVLGSTAKRVSKQPAKGSLFLSQNGSTWTPKQNQDMAYRIYTAKFKANGGVNFYNEPLEKHLHNFSTSLQVDSADTSRFRVEHLGHGLGVGDEVRITGLDSSGSYNGISGSIIMDQSYVAEDVDVNGYYVSLSSGNFSTLGRFGADSVETNRGFNVDRVLVNIQDLEFERTSIAYQGSFVSGVSHSNIAQTGIADPRFNIDDTPVILGNTEEYFFRTPRYVANPSQEVADLAGNPSVIIGATITSEQTSTFGGTSAVSALSSGYVSDVSPVIDTQTIGMVVMNNVVDNQANPTEIPSAENNAPANYVAETAPTQGTTPSKHITRIVQLGQAANGLKVLVDMYKPPAADFDLYYRTGSDADDDLYEKEWILATPDNSPPDALWVDNDDDISFTEYRYLIGGTEGTLDDFISFQVKIVLRTTNTCQPPVIGNIRSIALI